MKSSNFVTINEWKKRHDLNQQQCSVLLECYRRINMFHNGSVKANMVLLEYPSNVKPVNIYFYFCSYGKELKRCLNWYSLTSEGRHVMQDLCMSLKWDKEEMNNYLFTH